MSLTLSDTDQARLTTVFTAAASPLSYPSVDAWRRTVREHLVTLLGADRSVSWLHIDGEPPLEAPTGVGPAIAAYADYYHALDTGLSQRRRALGLEIVPLRSIYDVQQLPKTELWNDWSIPHHLHDALAITVDVPGSPNPVGFWFYHERASAASFGERGEALLRLVLPVVKAGIDALHQLTAQRRQLLTILDRLPQGVQLLNAAGDVLHENPALVDHLAQHPERHRVRAEMQRAAHDVSAVMERPRGAKTGSSHALGAPVRELRTGAGRMRIVATWLGPGLLAPVSVVLVLLESVSDKPPVTDLQTRYGLTAREIEVLHHVRCGASVPDLAERLQISRHTARHHVEALRGKLGVHRVGEIAALLTGAVIGAQAVGRAT
jgi:DNA-binding CsgD family transcriptional regulator/PAS domain-containing protein